MSRTDAFLFLIALAFIFLICYDDDDSSTPLNFDKYFNVGSSNSFLNGRF